MQRKSIFILLFAVITSFSAIGLTACSEVTTNEHSIYYVERTEPTCTENGNAELVPYAEPKVWDRYLKQDISEDEEKLQTILTSIAEATASFSEQKKLNIFMIILKIMLNTLSMMNIHLL